MITNTKLSTFDDYLIAIHLPTLIYKININGGRSVIVQKFERPKLNNIDAPILFEIIGKPYGM